MSQPKWTYTAMAAVFCLPFVANAQDPAKKQEEPKTRQVISPEPPKQEKAKKPNLTGQKAEDIKASLDAKRKEAKELQEKATAITVNIGKLAASGKLPQDEEAIKLMKSMVDELQEIKDHLKKIDEDIEGIKGWIEGQNEALPVLTQDVSDLKKNKFGGYLQFQYRDTDQRGGQMDSFRMRRTEIGLTHSIDSRTAIKVSFDLSTSNYGTANSPTDTSTTLKDANLIYDIQPSDVMIGTQLTMGQVKMPVGYELGRSSSEREFPEYAIYNQTVMSGERGRGMNLVHGLTKNSLVQAGIWNALTYNDAEQRSFQGSQGNKLGVSAGLRYFGKNYSFGISGFAAERPKMQAGYIGGTQTKVYAPTVDRQFLYLDGTYIGLFAPGLFIRGEAMIGKDRIPVSPNSTSSGSSNSGISDPDSFKLRASDMAGFHAIVGYNINNRNTFSLKYEQFDPNLDRGGDFVRGYGAAYSYYINPGAKVTLSHEIFQDDSRIAVGSPARTQTRYGVTTLRVQFKF